MWTDKTPQDIMADIDHALRQMHDGAPPRILLPYSTYRWLVRGRLVAMLSRRPRRRPSFANALRHR